MIWREAPYPLGADKTKLTRRDFKYGTNDIGQLRFVFCLAVVDQYSFPVERSLLLNRV